MVSLFVYLLFLKLSVRQVCSYQILHRFSKSPCNGRKRLDTYIVPALYRLSGFFPTFHLIVIIRQLHLQVIRIDIRFAMQEYVDALFVQFHIFQF